MTIKWKYLFIIIGLIALGLWMRFEGIKNDIYYEDDGKIIKIKSNSIFSINYHLVIVNPTSYGRVDYYFVDDKHDLLQCDDSLHGSIISKSLKREINGAFVMSECLKINYHKLSPLLIESGKQEFTILLNGVKNNNEDMHPELRLRIYKFNETITYKIMQLLYYIFTPFGTLALLILFLSKVTQPQNLNREK